MTRRVVAIVVAIIFAAVLFSFLFYTQQLAAILRQDAVVFSRLYALTFQETDTEHSAEQEQLTNQALATLLAELQRLQIPVVTTDTLGAPIDWAFLPFELRGGGDDLPRLRAYVVELDQSHPPLELGRGLQVHFGEPLILRRLRLIPWLQAAALLAIVGGGAWLVFTSFRSERERIWSAMARESAHQMGTPLSSLVGWLEQLEVRGRVVEPTPDTTDIVGEMQADVHRLLKVSRRFELIGRRPELEPVSVGAIVEHLRRYFAARLPTLRSQVRFEVEIPPDAPRVRGNETLLEWAFENLIKNSLDALAGQDGVIGVSYLGTHSGRAAFRVRDDGPGVASHVRKKVFEIGVTTKESGWGVGLSLTRRIIEGTHGGQITLETSSEGASFRVELPVAASASA